MGNKKERQGRRDSVINLLDTKEGQPNVNQGPVDAKNMIAQMREINWMGKRAYNNGMGKRVSLRWKK
jgi:hypothetical protein